MNEFLFIDIFTGTPDVGDHTYLVPLTIGTDTNGQINLKDFNLTYNPNPIVLNTTTIQTYLETYGTDNTDFSIPVYSLSNNITFDDLQYDYAGGNQTFSIAAHFPEFIGNVTRSIISYYSRWDYSFVPLYIDYLEFIPSTPTSSNVTPFGQVPYPTSKPILNITNYGYGDKAINLSVYLDSLSDCVNLTISTTENKTDGTLLTSSWNQLSSGTNYLEGTNISMWADYNCAYNNWTLFQPNLYFRQCPFDADFCSEDLS